jgi:subtilisin family serine protease
MSRATLTTAANLFFSKILPAATQKHFSDLANAEVLLGAYRRYSGAAVTAFGQSITPEFMLKVNPGAVAVQNDAPAFGDAPVAADAPNQPLIWLRFVADPKVDDQATIQDLMGDLDTYVARKFSIAGVDVQIPDGTASPANSQQWAQAVQANRAAFPDNLSTLTEIPAALKSVATDLASLKIVLSHFFTYDSTGAYYARWSGAGRQIPQDLTPAYGQKNVQEVKLGRDQMYVYLLAPKSLFTTKDAQAHDYYEAVLRFEETGDSANPYLPTLVHSAYKRMPDSTAPFHDFVFFEAEDGIGLNVPLAARVKMSGGLQGFLLSIPDQADDRAAFFHDSTHVIDGTPPLVSLLATTTAGDLTLPQEVVSTRPDSGAVIMMQAPLDAIPTIAALPGVLKLDLTGYPSKPSLNLVRPAISFDALRTKFAAGKQDGAGVIVGVIDSGIDGNHPSFKDASGNSRIVAYWDQGDGNAGNPNSPAAHNAGNAAYTAFNFGRERTGADCVNAADYKIGHGTHVSGIAAGSEVTAPAAVPRGIASAAQLIVVSAIERPVSRPDLGLKYIFQKATEMHMPCVVNMSFGQHDHAHDGTDDQSVALTRLLRDASNNYLPGRVLVAAAGNERDSPIHFRRNLVTNGSAVVIFVVNGLGDPAHLLNHDVATLWIRPTTPGAKPNLRISLQDPASGWTSSAVTPSTAPHTVNIPGMNLKLFFTAMTNDPHNGDFNVRFGFVPVTGTAPIARKAWLLLITNPGPAVEINAWDVRDGSFPSTATGDNEMKVGSPASAFDVISVACSCTRLTWPDIDNPALTRSFAQPQLGDLANFSSNGPIRTCSNRMLSLFGFTVDLTYPAIDIAAPGSATQSALASVVPTSAATPAGQRNRQNMVNNLSWMMQGTSMASPVITGLIACLMSDEPGLTQDVARNRVRAAGVLPNPATTLFKPGAPEPNDWGPGLVNGPALKP